MRACVSVCGNETTVSLPEVLRNGIYFSHQMAWFWESSLSYTLQPLACVPRPNLPLLASQAPGNQLITR